MAKGTRAASQHGLNLHIHVTQATPRPAADARRPEGYDAAYGTARARRGSYEPLHQSTRISGTSASYAAGKQCTLHAGLCHPALDQRWCFGLFLWGPARLPPGQSTRLSRRYSSAALGARNLTWAHASHSYISLTKRTHIFSGDCHWQSQYGMSTYASASYHT